MNCEQARMNMIKQQLRTWDVTDLSVLKSFIAVPREDFVPAEHRGLAFADTKIPLSDKAMMLSPKEEGRILQALALKPSDHVLEVGTGSGFFTALLAQHAQQVTTVDVDATISQQAKERLLKHGIQNVDCQVGDAASGWKAGGPFDVIVITAGMPILPDAFKSQLKVGGKLVAILGDSPIMHVVKLTRMNNSEWQKICLFETDCPMLQGAPEPSRFQF